MEDANTETRPDVVDPDETTDEKPKRAEKEPPSRGRLKMKTYALKKKVETRKRTFKCSECNVIKKTIKELNVHHEECHNP